LESNESYFEYSLEGKVINFKTKLLKKSKYEEDIYFNNHSTIFGSYFDVNSKKWGFSCCKQTDTEKFCTEFLNN